MIARLAGLTISNVDSKQGADDSLSRVAGKVSDAAGTGLLTRLRAICGRGSVISEREAQRRFLRDFSWYSPLLTTRLSDVPAEAVVRPRSLAELEQIVALAARTRTPLTLRGAGTGNYGQSVPLKGGIVVDVRGLDGLVAIDETSLTVEAGCVLGLAERAARAQGTECRVLPSTYRRATAAGFVAGGSGGIGSVRYGLLWDGNVLEAEILTAEETPRRLVLSGPALDLILHTYGTVGVITTVRFPLAAAREWAAAAAAFDSFDRAARFAWALGHDETVAKRLVSLQQAPIPQFFQAVNHLFAAGESVVLLLIDVGDVARTRAQIQHAGGRYVPWPPRPDISQYPFSHTILWAKHHNPQYTWLQLEFAPADFFRQLQALTARFGELVLHHVEFARAGSTLRPLGIPVLTRSNTAEVDSVMRFCAGEGVRVLNPHTYVAEEGGMVRDPAAVLRFKRQTDPHGILNPGKIGTSFYALRAAG